VIEQADVRLHDWVTAVAGAGVDITLAAPANGQAGAGVSVYLMDLASRPPMRGGARRTPLQLALRYLVSTWGGDPQTAHRLLGDLVLSAMQQEDFEVQLSPLPPELWLALGATPRPSFVLQVPVRQPRPEVTAPPVRTPLVVKGVALARLAGVVLGPGGVPVAAAHVEIPSAGVGTWTDASGRFFFPGVPAEPATKLVRVSARGRQLDVEIAQPQEDEPVVIHFDQLLEA
jgi:hypothetical protein